MCYYHSSSTSYSEYNMTNISSDAIGNNIIIGEYYGYTTSSSGNQNTTIGKAASYTEKTKRVTLQVVHRFSYLYGELSDYGYHNSEKVTVRSLNLFHISTPNMIKLTEKILAKENGKNES